MTLATAWKLVAQARDTPWASVLTLMPVPSTISRGDVWRFRHLHHLAEHQLVDELDQDRCEASISLTTSLPRSTAGTP